MSDAIQQIIISNFKSYGEAVIDLHPGINVIYGDPQAGKSNILRALELLMYNRPRGGGFMPNFEDKCTTKVAIIDATGQEIGIECNCHLTKKGAKKRDSTYYYIHSSQGNVWDATGVGSAVPAEITKALNLTEINLQFQKDPPFLATKSGSKISKTINRITGLDIGDRLSANLTSTYNSQNAVVKGLKAKLEGLKEEQKNFHDIKHLQNVIDRIKTLTQRIDQTERVRQRIQASTTECGHRLEVYNGLKVPDCGTLFNRIAEINSLIVDARSKIGDCNKALKCKSDYSQSQRRFGAAVQRYLDRIKELKQCPMCFTDIGAETLNKIERRIRGQ